MTQVAHGELDGRRAVVTGGASGIGYGMCELFAKRGATVFLLDLFPDKTAEAAAALGPKVPSHTLPARAACPLPPSRSFAEARRMVRRPV